MGSWMSYSRFRARNGLRWRPADDAASPYPPAAEPWRPVGWVGLVGDLNRMERDYLSPAYPEPPLAQRVPGSDPASECAAAIGVDVAIVRRVLAYVFLGQR